MDDISSLISRLKPDIIGIIEEMGLASSSGTASVDGVLERSQYPDALLRDGSRSLLSSLAVAAGATIDGVDLDVFKVAVDDHTGADAVTAHGTVGAHNHQSAPAGGQLDHGLALTGLDDDDHPQYASADGSGTRNAYQAARLIKQIIAGAGLTGGGVLDADRTLNVGAGTGISVAADTVAVDQTADFTWTGLHQFAALLQTQTIKPLLSDTYDLGASDRLWRKGWLSELDAVVFAENVTSVVGGRLLLCKDQGTLDAEALAAATTINFGKLMTPGDFVAFRAAGQIEWLQVGALSAGTTYNVTRNLEGDPGGPNAWPAGSVFAVYGTAGNHYIEANADDTPRISMSRVGAAYNTPTEVFRLGDLNGWGDYLSAVIGLALGEYGSGKPNITIDPTNGLRIRSGSTDVLKLDISGNAKIEGALTLGAAGGIWQGTGTFAGPTTGLRLRNDSGVGVLEAYNAGTLQAAFDSNGRFAFGGGRGWLYENGLRLRGDGNAAGNSIAWVRNTISGTQLAGLGVTETGSKILKSLYVTADSGYGEMDLAANNSGLGANGASLNLSAGASEPLITFNTRLGGTSKYALLSTKKLDLGERSIAAGGTAFPTSPADNDLFYRSDRDLLYFYNSATSKWLTVQQYTAPLLEATLPQPWNAANVGTGSTVLAQYYVDAKDYNAYVEGYINLYIVTTNNGSNFYTVTMTVAQNGGGGSPITLLNAQSTAGYSANSNNTVNLTAGEFAAVAQGAVITLSALRTGTPGQLSARPYVCYRLVG